MISSEEQLLLDLKNEKVIAFKMLFYEYFEGLCNVANEKTKDEKEAKEIVDKLLTRLYQENFKCATLPFKEYLFQELKKLLSPPECKEIEKPRGNDLGGMN